MDRLIALYEARQAGESSVGPITPQWPFSQMDQWVRELITEGLE